MIIYIINIILLCTFISFFIILLISFFYNIIKLFIGLSIFYFFILYKIYHKSYYNKDF